MAGMDGTYRSWACSLVALALKSSQTGYEHCNRTKVHVRLSQICVFKNTDNTVFLVWGRHG